MRILAKAVTPTNLFLNDINKPLQSKTVYHLAAVELGHDTINGGFTFGKVEAFTTVYIHNSSKVIMVQMLELDPALSTPGILLLFISKDGRTYQPLQFLPYKEFTTVHIEPLRSSPKILKSVLTNDLATDFLVGSRNPQPVELDSSLFNLDRLTSCAIATDGIRTTPKYADAGWLGKIAVGRTVHTPFLAEEADPFVKYMESPIQKALKDDNRWIKATYKLRTKRFHLK